MASRKALNGLLVSSDRSLRGFVLGRDAVVACLIGAMTLGCAACHEQGAGAQTAAPAQPSQPPASSKPADSKPADSKPADAKPADSKPATTTDGAGSKWPPGWVPMEPANPRLETTRVTIGGRSFDLEMALTDEQRFHGLSGRTEIKENEGMIFVFKNSEERAFVMRDCPIPIDILYLDGTGRIVSVHKMVPESPRTESERVMSPPKDARGRPMNVPQWAYSNEAYERRLKQYPSRFGTQFVIELREGSIDALKVKSGDKVELDVAGLKKRAK